jgi:DNA polymerase III delta prime subunit
MEPQTLEDYLAGDYHQDMDDIRELEETLDAVQNVFIHSCADGRWPYECRARPPANSSAAEAKVSHGTQAMIASALGKITGQCAMPSGEPARLDTKSDGSLRKAQEAGVKCLTENIGNGTLLSGTFGKNDPVTLSHVAELIRGLNGANDTDAARKLWAKIGGALEALATIVKENPALSSGLLPDLPYFSSTTEEPKSDTAGRLSSGRKPDYVINAFVPLRVVRAISSLAAAASAAPETSLSLPPLNGPGFEQYRKYFESTLYDQLSFSALPDSRFDAAELIFCLEGLLLCGPQAVDERVFEHVLKVLHQKQELSAQWRPNRPVFATPQGMTMLPVSVESAVSLARSIEIMDRAENYHRFSTLGAGLARRFWHWLRARKVQFLAPPETSTQETRRFSKFTGWHSEHVNDPGLIHLWDTSQVIEFMLAFRVMLQRNVAGRTLLLSRLKVDRPPRGRPAEWRQKWEETGKSFDPRTTGPNRVYVDRLTKDFVHPWGERRPANYSMLLYGPPGTGKSSLAENIADTLGMRMVTVTVSDFLGRGGENVEARAKAIFQTLEAQIDAVILFDEIDSFLLDRDTRRYGDQDSLFQFLTPGMLTKINDLRKRKRSLFIIATNYANRIDPAIKRRGRIDQRYLLSLPDGQKRLAIIKALGGESAVAPGEAEAVKCRTLFFGFSDLKNLVDTAKNGGGGRLVELLESGDYQPATSIESYLARHAEENFPFDELKDLSDLKQEVEPNFDFSELTPARVEEKVQNEFREKLKAWYSGVRGAPPGAADDKTPQETAD